MIRLLRYLYFLCILCLSFKAEAQYLFKPGELHKSVSILEYAVIADAGSHKFDVKAVRENKTGLQFKALHGEYGNLGFTHHNYWLKFELKNTLSVPIFYYLQTAEPITDNVDLYLFSADHKAIVQKSGDNIHFKDRPLPFRKTLFKIELAPGEKKQAFMEMRNDGERNSLPLLLLSQENLLTITYHDQFIMGLFYGIMFIIAITYLFFYFALNERSFLYYSLYVIFVGICQFALDGFFHQYIAQSNSLINLYAVIVSAVFGCYFFGKYSELILEIKRNSIRIHKTFKILYLSLGLILLSTLLFPVFLKYAYPLINVATFLGMLLIFASVVIITSRKKRVDLYYTIGIVILFICFALAILLNFGLLPSSLSVENITKPGIGLEIIALSLSMANRIRILKSNKEELQTIALQKSREMNDMKSYFLSNMSHELRTPLNAILGLTTIMEHETNDPKVKANFEILKNASHNLISSVNDILDFSKIEKGELKLDYIQFSPLKILINVSTNAKKEAEDKNLRFEFVPPLDKNISVIGDAHRLEQILNNILSNAVKFTTKGSVMFKVNSLIYEDHVQLSLIISDTGIGIPQETLDSVFEMFSQLDMNTKRKFGGFGIGLCVVKALVDLHGGTIQLISDVGLGTTCTVSLNYPLVADEQQSQNLHTAGPYDLMGKHILVVEDNKMNQMVISRILQKWANTTVSFVNDGAESLSFLLKEQVVDIILMDLQMPVMDGYEATTAIRAGYAGNHYINVPIIVLTADVMKATEERVFELGVNDYMTKPIDQNLLYKKIMTLLS